MVGCTALYTAFGARVSIINSSHSYEAYIIVRKRQINICGMFCARSSPTFFLYIISGMCLGGNYNSPQFTNEKMIDNLLLVDTFYLLPQLFPFQN
jgi:hypothetical protein